LEKASASLQCATRSVPIRVMSAPAAGEDTADASNDGDEPWTTVSGRNSRRSSRDGRPRVGLGGVGKHNNNNNNNNNPPQRVRVSPASSGPVRSEDEDADGEDGEIIDDGNEKEVDEEGGGAANQAATTTTVVRQNKKWVDATSENAYDVIAPPRTPTRPEKKKETVAVDGDDAGIDADGSGTEEGSASKPAKPAVNERRRAKRRARRLRRTNAALRALGGATSTGASEDDDEGVSLSAASMGRLAAVMAKAMRGTGEEHASGSPGESPEAGGASPVASTSRLTTPRFFWGRGNNLPPLPNKQPRERLPMSPPPPRIVPKTPKSPKTPKTPKTPAASRARDSDDAANGNAIDRFFHQMDLAFAGMMLAIYAFIDTVMKFIGIKVLRVSQSSRSVRQTEARVAQERAAVEEFEEILSAHAATTDFTSTSASASDVERNATTATATSNRFSRPVTPPLPSMSNVSTKSAHSREGSMSMREEVEEGELTPAHAVRRRLDSALGGAWGGGGGMPPSFRVARVDEDASHAHNELVSCVSSRGDEYITGGWDGTLRTWKWDPIVGLSGGTPMTGQHNDNVEFLSVDSREDHEHLAISGGRDCTVRIWDVCKRSQRSRIYAFENIASGCVDWSSQTVAVGSRGGAVVLWDAEKGAKKCTLRGHEGEITSMCTYDWSEGGATLYVSGGADGTVRVWDARQHVAVATMSDHRRRVYAVCPGPKGVIFAGDFSSTVKAHSLSNPGALPRLLPNVPGVDGCEAPIAGLEFVKLDGMDGGGLLLSTAAYFPLNENEESDDDDAPQGCVHVRAVDASGAGIGPLEGVNGDGYMYTLKGIEGLLTCASLTAASDGSRMRLVVGAGSGALGAYAEGGALSGQDIARPYPSTIEKAEELGVEMFD